MDNNSVDDIVRQIEFVNHVDNGEHRLKEISSFLTLIDFSAGKEALSEKTHDHTS